MPYIGDTPTTTSFAAVVKDAFSGDGSETAFTLSKIATTNSVAVFVENVRQEPTTAYAVSGTTLTFTAAPVSSSGNNIYVVHMNPTATATHPAAQNLTAVNGTLTGTLAVTGTSTLTGNVTASADLSVGDDLTLASDSSVINFGADSDVTITHDPDDGLIIKSKATADDNPLLLTLQTGETDLAANDVIGKIAFQAPDEGTGTDAVLVSAAIQAVAEGDHSSSSNATKLSFMTGASEAATEKMALSSGGALTVANGLSLTDGDVTVASGHGISFAATSDGTTMSSELLDDYEEGIITVGINVGTGSASVDSTNNHLTYTKVGRVVHMTGTISMGAESSTDGNYIQFTGLPFTAADFDGLAGRAAFYISHDGATVTDGDDLVGSISEGGAVINLYRQSEAGHHLGGGQIDYNSALYFNFHYFTT